MPSLELAEVILAIIIALIASLIGVPAVKYFLGIIVIYNLLLGFFNLLPFHPLDGFKIVYGLMPVGLAYQWLQMQNYGMYILIFMIFTGTIGNIIQPVLGFSLRILGF